MLPWKVFIRSVGAVTLLAVGGLAAGQDVLPFSHVSSSVDTQAVIDGTAPAGDVDETPTVDEAALPADDDATTTTTEVAEPAAPDTVDDEDVVTPSEVPVVEVTEDPESTTKAPPTDAPAVDAPDSAPAVPAEDDVTVICAAAAEQACGPTESVEADSSIDARVERCVAWWNRLADRFDERSRPRWAARARLVADRCDEMIARWEERQDRRQERRENRREKGDHNCDGRPDNGWHRTDGRHPATGERCVPGEAPGAGEARNGGRPETAPGQVKKAERHGEGRR